MIFGKKLLNICRVFWFCLQYLSEIFLILRRIQQDIIINVHRSSHTVNIYFFFFLLSWNLNFLGRFSKKNSNIRFYENPSTRGHVVPCVQTDRCVNVTSCFLQFCKCTQNLLHLIKVSPPTLFKHLMSINYHT
jgi:hypothetical protein